MASKTNEEQSSSVAVNFEKRLNLVDSTQESVQTLSLWILYHRSQAESLLKIWFKVLKKSKASHRLTLFYVANDVIQNSKKQNALVYQQAFKPYLNSAMLYVKEAPIKKKIQRILEIWRERNVYEDEFIDELLKKLLGTEVFEKDKEVNRLIAEFQPKSLSESLIKFKQAEGETLLKEQLVAPDLKLIDGMSTDTVRKLKDKSSTDTYHAEYQSSREKFQEYVHQVERLLRQRKALQQSCEQAETFYEAQYQDANIVVEAYKNFGDKVATLKRKLDCLIRDLPETTSSSHKIKSVSPGNTPPDYRQTDMELSDSDEMNSPSECTPIVKTTRTDPRSTRKHSHQRAQTQFDDADERTHVDLTKTNGEKKSATIQQQPMIDVNTITELLIQHSQSTGFEKSLEMLTQTLRQLTDASSASSQTNSTLPSANPFDNLLIKRLQTPIVPTSISTTGNAATPVWFNPTAPATYSAQIPTFFQTNPAPTSINFSPQQKYQNPRN